MTQAFPRSEIGLFQSDVEVLGTPAYDLDPFLRGEGEHWPAGERWGVHPLDEHTVVAATRDQHRFDALVIGFNALHQSPSSVKTAFEARPPGGNLLVLHQLTDAGFGFLKEEFALELRELPGREVHPIRSPAERAAQDEPLLNWPQPLPSSAGDFMRGRALRSFNPASRSVWRVVLALEREGTQYPVVMRTARVVPERIVVCSLLLEWRDPVHAALLENMLTYCALGSPEVAVLAPPETVAGYDPALLANRLRLRGGAAFVVPIESEDAVDVEGWPLRGVRHIVGPSSIAPESVLGGETPSSWAHAGGALSTVAAEAELTLHSRASDARWVAERWAAWYSGCSPAAWQDSLHATRAVLRTLAILQELPEAAAVAVEAPRDYPEGPLTQLMQRRIHQGSCEETISATSAALDIDHLVEERAMAGATREEVVSWLRDAFDVAPGTEKDPRPPPIEDRLDIARALRDPDLLGRAWDALADQPVTMLSLTRLREALVACHAELVETDAWKQFEELPEAVADQIDSEAVVAELHGRPLLSADFVAAASDLHRLAPGHPAADLSGRAFQAAVETLSARSSLSTLGAVEQADVEPRQITAEAVALLRHMTAMPTTTRQIRPESEGVPPQAVQEILHEARESRELVQREADAREAFGRATLLLGAGTFAVVSLAAARTLGWAHIGWPDAAYLGGGFLGALGALWTIRKVRARRGDPTPAIAGDVLGGVTLTAAACAGYLVLGLAPTQTEALDAFIALLTFGLAATFGLFLLRVVGLNPLWHGRVRAELQERVPFLRSSRDAAAAAN